MAKNVKVLTRSYHVYDPRMNDVAGVPVIEQADGSRTVQLSSQQAQYLIDQGAIGITPETALSDHAYGVLRQMRRERHEG